MMNGFVNHLPDLVYDITCDLFKDKSRRVEKKSHHVATSVPNPLRNTVEIQTASYEGFNRDLFSQETLEITATEKSPTGERNN